jgi:Mg-chelatase subunit ChlD
MSLGTGDAWQDALDVAGQIKSSTLVIDTENLNERLGRSRTLAKALGVEYIQLESPELTEKTVRALHRSPVSSQLGR